MSKKQVMIRANVSVEYSRNGAEWTVLLDRIEQLICNALSEADLSLSTSAVLVDWNVETTPFFRDRDEESWL